MLNRFRIACLVLLAPAIPSHAGTKCAVTPGLHVSKLGFSERYVFGRLPMNFPEGNAGAHSNRQIRVHLPLMRDDTADAAASASRLAPTVQATIETLGQGPSHAMLIYSIQRFEENGCMTLVIDAQTPDSKPTELPYFLNLTVAGF